MKTKTHKKDKVNVVTLGCSKNIVDSENMLTQLRGNQIEATHEDADEQANVIIVNTCGFIDGAKEESVNTILQYSQAKSEGLIDRLFVTGCLSERYKDDLEQEIPNVDAYYGTRDLPALLKHFKADYKHELLGERFLTTPGHYAFFKIAEGCDRPCSFCAIPLMRGKHVSRPMDELVHEAKNMAARGTKELILIAQDLTYYGLDIYKKRCLSELLKRLSDVEGIDWIRLQYAYPSGFPLDIIEVMRERDNICNYLDMPLQHISDNMLKRMRRGINQKRTYELLHKIKDINPDIALRTTLLLGHPGETEEDFDELSRFVEAMRFDRLGVFKYSHEEGTHAYSMEDNVPDEIKEERANILMEMQQGISAELNQEKVGQTEKVLFDRKEGDYFIGRTAYDSPEVDNEVLVNAENQQYVRLGDFANVKITHASDFDLYGELAD